MRTGNWFFRYVPEAHVIPRGYGLAYRVELTGVFCPIPFNWLVRWAMNCYWRLVGPRKNNWLDREIYAAYEIGYMAGKKASDKEHLEEYIRGLGEISGMRRGG